MAAKMFDSDKEGDNSTSMGDFVEKKLGKLRMDESSGVDVDGKMLEGRKANRGFTISVKSRADVEEGIASASLRSNKRAQTMPSMGIRRGDFHLSAEATQKLMDATKALQARKRRGSATVCFSVIPDDVLEGTWNDPDVVKCHSHGINTTGQSHGDERESVKFGAEEFPGAHPPIISCLKGSKGVNDTGPNQDNFSITYYANGWSLACAFDGHGPWGHEVSTRTVQTVPYFLSQNANFPLLADDSFLRNNVEKALIEAFELAHKDCVAKALDEGWDVQASGSTAVAAFWKGNEVYTANCGDSRVVIGTESEKKLIFETADHKPDSPGEKERIECSGGEVRSQTYPDGWVNHRIFVKGEDYPGLCMARTLGDVSVKEAGVICTPEIAKTTIDRSKEAFMVLASDGVWEFLDSGFVVKAVAKKIQTDGPVKTVTKLQREARKRWKAEEGDYCDDITSILIRLHEEK
eukprot:TRINITY_DN30256_c0_g1_i1.p1 TRINITY_DN30256_c0_g1~~TRINITY_DN30256_c0_g1_i1.p1  ORF type:complete len:464 (+),score=97.46 TRINITY_DN30256_c0_g1_i1:185-1576(+)